MKWIVITFSFFLMLSLNAQERTRILFLVDGSMSMRNEWKGGTKWNVATEVLHDLADSIQEIPNTEMGMRVFGHLYPEPDKNCKDSRLEVRIDSNNAKAIQKKTSRNSPEGHHTIGLFYRTLGHRFWQRSG